MAGKRSYANLIYFHYFGILRLHSKHNKIKQRSAAQSFQVVVLL